VEIAEENLTLENLRFGTKLLQKEKKKKRQKAGTRNVYRGIGVKPSGITGKNWASGQGGQQCGKAAR